MAGDSGLSQPVATATPIRKMEAKNELLKIEKKEKEKEILANGP